MVLSRRELLKISATTGAEFAVGGSLARSSTMTRVTHLRLRGLWDRVVVAVGR